MLNIPGTLLIVRKRPGVNFNYDLSKFEFATVPKYMNKQVHVPYGAAVMMLTLETLQDAASRSALPGKGKVKFPKAKMILKVLYDKKYLILQASQNQLNRFFTYPDTWEKHKKRKEDNEQKKSS